MSTPNSKLFGFRQYSKQIWIVDSQLWIQNSNNKIFQLQFPDSACILLDLRKIKEKNGLQLFSLGNLIYNGETGVIYKKMNLTVKHEIERQSFIHSLDRKVHDLGFCTPHYQDQSFKNFLVESDLDQLCNKMVICVLNLLKFVAFYSEF